MALAIHSTSTICSVKINECLNPDILYLVFKMVSEKKYGDLFVLSRVCRLWRNLTHVNPLWKKLAHRLKIVEPEKIMSLPLTISEILGEARNMITDGKPLLIQQETRIFELKVLGLRVQRLQGDEKTKLEHRLMQKLHVKIVQQIKLKKTFFACMQLHTVGCHTLKRALDIAQHLASDYFMEKKPLDELKRLTALGELILN
jgi:hypothetical protein